jgi:hypothetical protein
VARTRQQQLDDVDAAIAAIEQGAQSYTTPLGHTFVRGNLGEMYRQRDQLQGEVALEAAAGDGPIGVMELGLGRVQ